VNIDSAVTNHDIYKTCGWGISTTIARPSDSGDLRLRDIVLPLTTGVVPWTKVIHIVTGIRRGVKGCVRTGSKDDREESRASGYACKRAAP
jgi:hypothetical protein